MVAAHLRRVLVFVIDDNIFIRCYLLYWKFLHTSIFRNIHLILSVFSANAILKCLVSHCKRPEIFIFIVIKILVKVELKTNFFFLSPIKSVGIRYLLLVRRALNVVSVGLSKQTRFILNAYVISF